MDTQQTAQVYSADIRLLEKRRTTLISEIDRLRKLHATTKREVDELQRQKVSLIHAKVHEAGELQTVVGMTGELQKELDVFTIQVIKDLGTKTLGRIHRLVAREKAASANTVALALSQEGITKKEKEIAERETKAGEKLAAAIVRQQAVVKAEAQLKADQKVAGDKLREANTAMQKAHTQEAALRGDIVTLGTTKGKLVGDIKKLQAELDALTPVMQRSAQQFLAREETTTRKEADLSARERKLVDREQTLLRTIQRMRAKGYTGVI